MSLLGRYIEGDDSAWTPPRKRLTPFTWLDALAGDTSESHFSVNMTNAGAVSNLPDWAVLDLECHIDIRGVAPIASEPLPELIAEVVRRHQVVFEMSARAAIMRDRALLEQAIQLCPFGDYMQAAGGIVDEAKAAFGGALPM
jgi:alpha-galactosidase/6-phospho-beta-glucosidase family protein